MLPNQTLTSLTLVFITALASVGCSLVPEKRLRGQVHNPFPQMKRVAVLPFFNQSENPTVDAQSVAGQYYAELQAIPGFEVMPMGVTRQGYVQYSRQFGEPQSGAQFQALARFLGVEAVVAGSITDYDAYYPPRMAMTTNWFAANEGFHPVPAGYGLPWGTDAEAHIPQEIVREAEFELARSQLVSQTPVGAPLAVPTQNATGLRPVETMSGEEEWWPADEAHQMSPPTDVFADGDTNLGYAHSGHGDLVVPEMMYDEAWMAEAPMPPDWPSPEDLIPDPPAETPPPMIANHDPVLSHTRIYRGDDPAVTERLADYVETGDDARPGGWQGYLRRSDDFVRFCCHLHIIEMLESRGGREQSDLILRWPLSRY